MNHLRIITQNENEKKEINYSKIEECYIGCVFSISNIINYISSYFEEIYEANDCIRDTIDSTNYLIESTCRKCSHQKKEPMEKMWISINYFDLSSNNFIDEYYILGIDIHELDNSSLEFDLKNKDELVIFKGYNKKNKDSYYLCSRSKNLVNYLTIERSLIHFLSITYRYGDQIPISLIVDKQWLIVGNEILGYVHVLRMLEYQNEGVVFNMNYVLDIIDSNIEIFQLKSYQYLKIEKNKYTVENILL
jgi:hypothetical protein